MPLPNEGPRYKVVPMKDSPGKFVVWDSAENKQVGEPYDNEDAAKKTAEELEKKASAPPPAKPPASEPPIPAREASPPVQPVRVTEKGEIVPHDAVGRKWDIAIVEEGTSRNGYDYLRDTIVRDARVFEGVPIGVSWEGLAHHDIIGKATDVRAAEVRGRDGHMRMAVVGFADITDPPAQKRLLEAYKAGEPLEFSIDCIVNARESRKSGKVVQEVLAFTRPTEITVVKKGAAGGRIQRLVASAPSGDQEMSGAVMRPAASANDAEQALLKAEAAARQFELRVQESETRALLAEKLASSKLPADTQLRVRESFSLSGGHTRVATPAEIDEAIKKEREYLARIVESTEGVRGCGVAVDIGPSERERYEAAMDGFFKGHDVKLKNGESVPRFRSFVRAAETVIGRGQRMDARDILRHSQGYQPREIRATEAYKRVKEGLQTSDWAEILGDSVTRQLLDAYQLDDRIRQVKMMASAIVPINDFRTNRRMRLGGYGLLPTVAERGTYQPLTSPGDEEATYAIAKKGGTEDVSLEMVANDDVGAIKQIPVKLAQAAAETIHQAIFDIPRLNTTNIYDASPLFRTANKTASAFGKATMNTARKTMRQQAAFGDSTKKLGATNLPFIWFGPADLEEAAEILFNARQKSTAPETSTTAETSTVEPNIHKGVKIEVVDYFSDAADCFVMANPQKMHTLEIGFYQGKEEPELFTQDMPNVGSMFNADKMTWKIRHIWGFSFLDFRGFFGFSYA